MDDVKSLFRDAVTEYGRKQGQRSPREARACYSDLELLVDKFRLAFGFHSDYGEARSITRNRFALGELTIQLEPEIVIVAGEGETPKPTSTDPAERIFSVVLQCKHCDFEVSWPIQRPSESGEGLYCIGEAIHEADERFRETEHICRHESLYKQI